MYSTNEGPWGIDARNIELQTEDNIDPDDLEDYRLVDAGWFKELELLCKRETKKSSSKRP